MSHSKKQLYPGFSISEKQKGIVEFMILSEPNDPVVFDLDYLTWILQKLMEQQSRSEIKGTIIHFSGVFKQVDWLELFKKSKANAPLSEQHLQIIEMILNLQNNKKLIIGIYEEACLSYAFTCLLFCDYRIAVGQDPQIGFPETEFGLFPPLGSTVFLYQILGAQGALDLLENGKIYTIQKSLGTGLIDAHFDQLAQAKPAAEELLFTGLKNNSRFRKQTSPDEKIVIQAIQKKINPLHPAVDFYCQIFQRISSKSIQELLLLEKIANETLLDSAPVKAVVRTLYDGVRRAKNQVNKSPKLLFPTNEIAIIGAGMMGAGIAFVSAKAGISVDLKDETMEMSIKGKEMVQFVAQKAAEREKISDQEKEDLLDRVKPLHQWDEKEEKYDLIIEAVFEDKELKSRVSLESYPSLSPTGLMASNTTSLPITTLAESIPDSSKFIGLHFFSPVERMPLVEIISGKYTSEKTLQKALQFVDKLGKIPIQVNDGPAFFTSRIFFNYLLEGIMMLLQGIPADYIEKSARHAGYAVGPLAVLDEISLPLMIHVYKQLPELSESQRKASDYLEKLVQNNRLGRRSAKGFYTYHKDGTKQFWRDPELEISAELPDQQSLNNRLLFVVALDAYRCLAQRILRQPIDGDIGSILGIGFPKFTGGVFSLIDLIGVKDFVESCRQFQEFGDQWQVPDSLITLANADFKFYTDFKSNWEEI